ncbi:UDP-N-acetylmuramate--alanine ligase [Caldicoprobacter guelmensis]|uniref:UDP-N-acetylmuramate--L-alanine ligase n=1 Tax=Caldicoprobacter guelmensis TaxID=1170224 RepID=UPI00195D2754|nr:UDP-N-acetylmuramate--L-alanine ligase [Caldicoprobacter guelmensis]MBM7582610.1 UDP-N-acetylmuramate--alanine ligase [Caldicoprobacter guelmensis]
MQMVHIDDLKGCHVHFVGIGGISMSGLAEILLKRGYTVSGSDLKDSHIIQRLNEKGARIYIGHSPSNVEGAHLVVHTAAVKADNPEIQEAYKRSIPVIDRATLLGQIMESYPYSIGVSGSHGKTTTTSMLSTILLHANLDPTILVGGELDTIGGNVRIGSSPYFITEACEYVESFLHFKPYIAIILNIDADHLDYFRDINHIYQAFSKFAQLVPQDGYVVGCADDPLVKKLLSEVKGNVISYGINGPSDWQACDIYYKDLGTASFKAYYKGKYMGDISLAVPGKHNVYNALASAAAAHVLGVPFEIIQDALKTYRGTHRRLEFKGKMGEVTIIDDYAHHPTEIKATLETVKNYPHNRIWCVFQPHTYSRTKKLFNEFVQAFKQADLLIITDIYAAREKDTGEVHSRNLAQAISQAGQPCIYMQSFDEIANYLKENASPGDIVITMGAGDVYRIGDMLVTSFPQ